MLPQLPAASDVISYTSLSPEQLTAQTDSGILTTLATAFIAQKADDVEAWLFANCAPYPWPLPNEIFRNYVPMQGLTQDEITCIGARQGRRASSAVAYLCAAQIMMLVANPSEIYIERMRLWKLLGQEQLQNIMDEVDRYKYELGLAGSDIISIKIPDVSLPGEFTGPILFLGVPNECCL